MFIGVDLTHPSPGSPYKHTSIAAVVTNSGSRCSGCRQPALQVNTPILVVKGGGRTSDGCSSRQNSVQGILSWISGSRTGIPGRLSSSLSIIWFLKRSGLGLCEAFLQGLLLTRIPCSPLEYPSHMYSFVPRSFMLWGNHSRLHNSATQFPAAVAEQSSRGISNRDPPIRTICRTTSHPQQHYSKITQQFNALPPSA